MELQDGVISGWTQLKNLVRQGTDKLQRYLLFFLSLNKLQAVVCVKMKECEQMSEGNTADKWACL